MPQGSEGDEADGVVAVVAVVSAKKRNNRSPSPVTVVVSAPPEYGVVEEDGVALLSDAESPAVRNHGDLFASCQLLTNSFEEDGEFAFTYLYYFLLRFGGVNA